MPSKALQTQRPWGTLTAFFVLWKTIIFLIALTSPGSGYDTSTTLLDWSSDGVNDKLATALSKFVRWDAIYFTHITEHGHVFEQEWAFGTGLSSMLRFISSSMYH